MINNEILKNLRKRLNLTQKEISEILGITVPHISNIENGKKSLSKKNISILLEKFNTKLLMEEKELFDIEISKIKKTDISKKKLIEREKKLLEKELLVNNTYNYLRENNFILSKVAAIQDELVELNHDIDKRITKIELSLDDSPSDLIVLEKLQRPFKTTIKRLENKIETIKKISDISTIEVEERGVMQDFSYLPDLFTIMPKEHKEMAIQVWIANNLRFRWKDYNNGNTKLPQAFSKRLWGAGRGKQGSRIYMQNRIGSDLELQTLASENSDEFDLAVREVAENLIERSIVVAESLLKAARQAKTESVRRKYSLAMNDQEFLINLLRICVHLYALEMREHGHSLASKYLEVKIDGSIEYKERINDIWRNVGKGIIEPQEAIDKSNLILKEYERITLSEEDLKRVGQEQMVLAMAGERNITDYMVEIMAQMVERLTGRTRMFDAQGNDLTER